MIEHRFRAWHRKEGRMYFRGYQKFLHVLLCDDDEGRNEGRGRPAKRASYEDCELMEWTTLVDRHGRDIYEGDIVRVRAGGKAFEDTVGAVPDMFGSKKIHPLAELFKKHGLPASPENVEIEIVGNRFEGVLKKN